MDPYEPNSADYGAPRPIPETIDTSNCCKCPEEPTLEMCETTVSKPSGACPSCNCCE